MQTNNRRIKKQSSYDSAHAIHSQRKFANMLFARKKLLKILLPHLNQTIDYRKITPHPPTLLHHKCTPCTKQHTTALVVLHHITTDPQVAGSSHSSPLEDINPAKFGDKIAIFLQKTGLPVWGNHVPEHNEDISARSPQQRSEKRGIGDQHLCFFSLLISKSFDCHQVLLRIGGRCL